MCVIRRHFLVCEDSRWDPSDGPLYFAKKTFPPDCWDPPATSSDARKFLTVGTHLGGRLTCGPTKLTGTECFVHLVNLNDLAAVIVRCLSNGCCASLTSGLLALAAQTITGRAACSCLPWPAVLPRRPQRPLLLPPLARPCGDGSLTQQPNQ